MKMICELSVTVEYKGYIRVLCLAETLYTYIIGHYNPSVNIIDLVSHGIGIGVISMALRLTIAVV